MDTPTSSFEIDAAYFWLIGAGFVLVSLVFAFGYLLIRRERDWFGEQIQRLDAWLDRTAPRPWHALKRRFSSRAWFGLEVTVAASAVLGLIYLFAEITEGWTSQDALYRLDRAVHQFFAGTFSDATTQAIRLVTHFGDGLMLVGVTIPLAAWLLYKKRWRRLAEIALVGWVGQAVPWGLKWLFARERPDGGLAEALSYSFPSGHSFTAMTLWGLVIYLIWLWTDSAATRILATIALSLLILCVGLSRVLLSVHWVSDVIGGLTIGLAWLVLSLVLVRTVAKAHG